jgi:hypothetical protein
MDCFASLAMTSLRFPRIKGDPTSRRCEERSNEATHPATLPERGKRPSHLRTVLLGWPSPVQQFTHSPPPKLDYRYFDSHRRWSGSPATPARSPSVEGGGAWQHHHKSVNQNTDIFLPKTGGGPMLEGSGPADNRTRIEERTSDIDSGNIAPSDLGWLRGQPSEVPRRPGKGAKIFPQKISRNPLIRLDSDERIQGNPSFSNP